MRASARDRALLRRLAFEALGRSSAGGADQIWQCCAQLCNQLFATLGAENCCEGAACFEGKHGLPHSLICETSIDGDWSISAGAPRRDDMA